MEKNSVYAGLGRYVLNDYRKKYRQLLELEQRIREISGRIYSIPSPDLGKPMVDHGRVLDRLERNAITLQALQQERAWIQLELEQNHLNFEQIREMMRPDLWEILQAFLPADSFSEDGLQEPSILREKTSEELREQTEDALYELWLNYQKINRKDPAKMAVLCRYVKKYYEDQVRGGKIAQIEAEKEMQQVMGISVRGIYRKIRLLYLEKEIRDWVTRGRISETGAYHLSFLKKSQQLMLISLVSQCPKNFRITPKIALSLRKCSFSDWYHEKRIREILR